ncbi:hypothetical protein BD408DRAFT_418693 [Parasitella parasitica]|nr:hypothetical protein BD408DRAFT_418693 [Parasitella parasitica]
MTHLTVNTILLLFFFFSNPYIYFHSSFNYLFYFIILVEHCLIRPYKTRFYVQQITKKTDAEIFCIIPIARFL